MTDYYVQIRKGGAWHKTRGTIHTACGIWQGEIDWLRGVLVVWDTSDEPREPLCKRCERIAEKEKPDVKHNQAQ